MLYLDSPADSRKRQREVDGNVGDGGFGKEVAPFTPDNGPFRSLKGDLAGHSWVDLTCNPPDIHD